MIRMYPSDVEAATALAPPELVGELLQLGFAPTTGVDIVSKNRIGNLLAFAREQDDVIAFISLSRQPTTTFGTLRTDGGVLFTSNSPHESVSFPRVNYVSQKFPELPLHQLLDQHLADVDGRAQLGHSEPDFALALQRRHAEINEARRQAAQWGLYFINLAALLAVAGTAYLLVRYLIPLVADGMGPSLLVVPCLPAAALVAFASYANFGRTPYGKPVTQYIGLLVGAGLPRRTLEETLSLGDMFETGR